MATRATKALRLAVRDALISGLSLAAGECAVTVDGRPHPLCGQRYIAVHPGGWTNRANDHFDEQHGLFVTVTLRLQQYPADREDAMIDLDEALEDLCQQVATVVHASASTIMAAANSDLDDSEPTANGFAEPLRFRDCSPPAYRDGAWFRADPDEPVAGVSRTLRFLEARRLVRIT